VIRVVGYGPQESRLKLLANELGVLDRVRFVGPIENSLLPSLYQNATVFAAPFVKASSGDEEGLGLVLVEALGCGCPSVVSDIPATRDVTDGIEGVITVPQRDVGALSEALNSILDDPRSFRAKLARSIPLLSNRFSWAAVGRRYSSLLIDVAE
jgi:glycosyltransferase involved in cell wall biosynthesis